MTTRHSSNGKGRFLPSFACDRMSSDGQEASPDRQRAELDNYLQG